MLTRDNTNGFTDSDLDLMNRALRLLIEDGIEESNAADIVNNNWTGSGYGGITGNGPHPASSDAGHVIGPRKRTS